MLEIFVIKRCNFCKKTIKLVHEHNIRHRIINVLDEDKDEVKRINNMTTFPMIFYNIREKERIRIGGYSDFEELVRKGIEKKS